MDNEILVNELKKVVIALRKDKGHVALFMLNGTGTQAEQTWNLIASVIGYDEIPLKKALVHLINLMRENVIEAHLKSLTRATILKTSDPFVKSMNQAFNVKNSTARIQSSNIFGIYIENAILLESQKPPMKSGSKKQKKASRKKKS